jgi:C2H2-type zinc finger protein/C2H2 type zinc finger protein
MVKYKCIKCNKEYSSKQWYEFHVKEKKCDTTCKKCKEKFTTIASLNRHISNNVCTRISKPHIICNKCGQEFPDGSRLKKHHQNRTDCSTRNPISYNKMFECPDCFQTYSSKQMLVRHMKEYCTGEINPEIAVAKQQRLQEQIKKIDDSLLKNQFNINKLDIVNNNTQINLYGKEDGKKLNPKEMMDIFINSGRHSFQQYMKYKYANSEHPENQTLVYDFNKYFYSDVLKKNNKLCWREISSEDVKNNSLYEFKDAINKSNLYIDKNEHIISPEDISKFITTCDNVNRTRDDQVVFDFLSDVLDIKNMHKYVQHNFETSKKIHIDTGDIKYEEAKKIMELREAENKMDMSYW